MHYFVGRVPAVVASSGRGACDNLLGSPDVRYNVAVPSRVFSKQLKHAYLFWFEERARGSILAGMPPM